MPNNTAASSPARPKRSHRLIWTITMIVAALALGIVVGMAAGGLEEPADLAERRVEVERGLTANDGSGKSSFSEAFELALTGDTYRWNRKNKQSATWSQHWRNLHDGEPCEVRVELAEEGSGTTTVGVDWADGPDLMNRKTWVQRAGQRRQAGVSGLGWSRALELYQPILSYDELGGLLQAGPSKL